MRTLIIFLFILQASLLSVSVLAEKSGKTLITTVTEAEKIFAEGQDLFYEGKDADDIKRGYVLIKNAAEYGLGSAQAMLGLYNHFGVEEVFLEPNYESSKYWFEKALKSNEFRAYMGLAMLYIESVVTEQNLDHALELLIKGAESGHLGAQEYLGDVYRSGYFKTYLTEELILEERFIDTEKALKWYKIADENGSETVQNNIGLIYYDGREPGEIISINAALRAGLITTSSLLHENEIDNVQISRTSRNMAFRWFLKAASNNSSYGQYNVGLAFMNGVAVEKNLEKAMFYFKLSAKQEYVDAMIRISELYLDFAKKNELFKEYDLLQENFAYFLGWLKIATHYEGDVSELIESIQSSLESESKEHINKDYINKRANEIYENCLQLSLEKC